jgi:hypothetical protein
MLRVIELTIAMIGFFFVHFAVCHCADFKYAKWRYFDIRYAECLYADYCCAEWCFCEVYPSNSLLMSVFLIRKDILRESHNVATTFTNFCNLISPQLSHQM